MDREEILKVLIDKTGLSMRAFSEKAGIPNTTLHSMLSRGIGKASVDNVIKVCETLGITIEELQRMSKNSSLEVASTSHKKEHDKAIDTLAAHFNGKNLTPKKIKLIENYIDALFEDEEA